jgi:hypothetical protein
MEGERGRHRLFRKHEERWSPRIEREQAYSDAITFGADLLCDLESPVPGRPQQQLPDGHPETIAARAARRHLLKDCLRWNG